MEFRFYPLRLGYTARGRVAFGDAANFLRGRFGAALREADLEAYRQWFEPKSKGGPSGLADRPRAFVLRAAHLNGRVFAPGAGFHLDFHLFETRRPRLDLVRHVFASLLDADLEELDAQCMALPLDPGPRPVGRVRVRFLTPTELKIAGGLAGEPLFPILAARVRDRIAMLAELYNGQRLAVDFAGLGERAARIQMTRCELQHVAGARRSGRTGRTHPLGGFVGEADYTGDLREFLPFLEAAQWTGVGRQTAWGKGALRVDAGSEKVL